MSWSFFCLGYSRDARKFPRLPRLSKLVALCAGKPNPIPNASARSRVRSDRSAAKERKNRPVWVGSFFGCGSRIRTQTYRVRVCCATLTQIRKIMHPIRCMNYYITKSQFVKGNFEKTEKTSKGAFSVLGALLRQAEKESEQSAAVKGNEGVQIALLSLYGAVRRDEDRNEQQPREVADPAEECRQGEREHPKELKGVAKLVVLLGEARDGNDRHIEDHVGREPADRNGEVPEDQPSDDAERIGEKIRGVHAGELESVDGKLDEKELEQNGERARVARDHKGERGGKDIGVLQDEVPGRGQNEGEQEGREAHETKVASGHRRQVEVLGLLQKIKDRGR